MYTLKHLGQTRTLAAWKIDQAILRRRNLDASTLTLTIRDNDAFAEPLFGHDEQVELFRDAERIFVGRITQFSAAGDAKGEYHQYVAADAWQTMAELLYRQNLYYRLEDNSVCASLSTTILIGADTWGQPIGINAGLQFLFAFIHGQVPGLVQLDLEADLGAIPVSSARDLSCAEVIRRHVQWRPDLVGWIDPSTEIPTFRLYRRPNLAPAEIDLGDSDTVRSFSGLRPRADMILRGCVFTLLYDQDPNAPESPRRLRFSHSTAGEANGPRVLWATLHLAEIEYPRIAVAGVDGYESLAARYLASTQTVHWQGTLMLAGVEVPWSVHVGRRLNLTGGRAAWTTMNAVVQATTHDLTAGTSEIELGPPEHLGPQDFISLAESFRQRRPDNGWSATNHNGTAGTTCFSAPGGGSAPGGAGGLEAPNEFAGASTSAPPGLFSFVDLETCQNGEPVTVRVLGHPI